MKIEKYADIFTVFSIYAAFWCTVYCDIVKNELKWERSELVPSYIFTVGNYAILQCIKLTHSKLLELSASDVEGVRPRLLLEL